MLDEVLLTNGTKPNAILHLLMSWPVEAGKLSVSTFGPPPSKSALKRATDAKRAVEEASEDVLRAKRQRVRDSQQAGDPFIPARAAVEASYGQPGQSPVQAYDGILTACLGPDGPSASLLAFSEASRSAAGLVQRNGRGDFPLTAIANVLVGSAHQGHPDNHVISTSDTIRALFSRDSAIIRLLIERWSVTGSALQGAL